VTAADGGRWEAANPSIDNSVRGLCVRPYPNHPKGCPNFNKRDLCPPRQRLIGSVIDLDRPTYVVWNRFDFGDHVNRMRTKHPEWSTRQAECCLYWQGTARKQLRGKVADFLGTQPNGSKLIVLTCPEACGVDVTKTMLSLGVALEWPPDKFAYQVAVVGFEANCEPHF